MFRLMIVLLFCSLVLTPFAEAQISSKLTTKTRGTQNITPYQPRDKESAALLHLSAAYHVDDIQYGRTGLPEYISGDLTPAGAGIDAAEIAYAFFEDNASLFSMKNPRQELRVVSKETDEYGVTHVTFLQYADGVPVFTGDWKAHLSADYRLRSVNGEYLEAIDISPRPSVSARTAESAVIENLRASRDQVVFRGEPELWVYPGSDAYYLTWSIIEDGPGWEAWRYFVDAHTGRVVHRIPLVKPEGPARSPAGAPKRSISDSDVLNDLSTNALEGANSQVVFGHDGVWIRSQGEYSFRPATIVTDFNAAAEHERARLHEQSVNDWRDFVLDLRAPGALEIAQGRGLVLMELAQPGYYRTHTSKQIVDDLSANGIDAGDYPNLPGVRSEVTEQESKRDTGGNPLDEVLFTQDFEGIFPPAGWSVGDANGTNGYDYWDDINCQYHGGYWSGWCAATGDMTDCANYDDYMTAYMSTPAVDVWGRSHLNINYWWRNISEPGYDYFRMYVSLDNTNWVLFHEHTGSSPAWSYRANDVFILGGGDWMYIKFEFFSDLSVHSYEGAYVDDIQLTGDWASCGFVGSGTGMMGQWFSHVDDTWNGSSYILEDKTRVTDPWGQNCQHGHEGQMGNTERIVSWNQNSGIHFTDADNNWNAPTGIDNMVYQTALYDFMRQQLGRNSYNNVGSSMYALVNSTGCTDNAFGGGSTITFCQPSAGRRGTAGAPDVVGHEWGHSITATESNLIYERESGALDEAWCDILGASFGIHTGYDNNWLIGDFTFTNGLAWRNMENPGQFGQPDCYLGTNWYPCDPASCPVPNDPNDGCGVHTNSGVPDRMFTLLANGGTQNNVTVNGIGLIPALQVVYVANRDYWTQNTGMSGGRAGCISAANAISPTFVTPVTNAWAAVCVGSPVETPLNCSNPIVLSNGAPYSGTTADGEGHVLSYNCSAWNESGREKVHLISPGAATTISVTLTNMGVDLDVFLLTACDDNTCVAYGNDSFTYNAAAQPYLVVVDGYNGVNGSYTITYCATPGTTNLGTPAEGAMICSGASQIYTWNYVSEAFNYTIQWDDNPSFFSPEEYVTTLNQTYHTLNGSGTWYWRVRANTYGNCPSGPFTTARSIQLSPVPAAPVTGTPGDGAMVCSGAVQRYTWDSVPTAYIYYVQWDDDPAFGSPLEQSTNNTYIDITLNGSGTWYWRVRGMSVCGYGAWSATRTIALTPVPVAPVLVTPGDGAIVCSGAVQHYSWESVPTAFNYIIQWDDDPAFGSPLEQSTANLYIDITLYGSGTWYWRVRGLSVCGYGYWSGARTMALTPLPVAPVLQAPADGAAVCSGTVQHYAWNSVPTAFNYIIQWDDDPAFGTPLEQSTADLYMDITLNGSGAWYWRVRGLSVCGLGDWSTVRTIALTPAPAAVTLVSPPEGAMICSGASQSYTWLAVTGATSYTIQWADNSGFGSPVEQTVTGLSANQVLTGSGSWYWRVRASNACGTSSWSTTRTISLTPIPGVTTLSSPPDGAGVCSGVSQSYAWLAVASALSYTIQWDDNSGFGSPMEQTVAGLSTNQALAGSGTWYWRVRASNGCGVGNWSTTRTILLSPVPGETTLSAPPDGAGICSGSVQTYSWSSVAFATSYTVQWDDNSGFGSPEEQTVAGTSANQVLTGSGTWYWRARGNNSCGNGTWSVNRSIVLIATPATPVMVSPMNGAAVCSGVSQTYAWDSVPGAADYGVQWDDNSGFSSPIEQVTAGLSLSQSLVGSGPWYWRVRANNACDSGAWAIPWTFHLIAVPAQVVLTSPPDGALIESGVPVAYCWDADAMAATYTVEWDDDPGFSSPIQAASVGTCYSQTLTGTGTWYWHARAENSCGFGVWSNTRSIVLGVLEPPVVVIVPQGAVICLAWPPVQGAVSYRIEYSSVPDTGFSYLTSTPDTTITQPVSAGDIRFFRVIAEQ